MATMTWAERGILAAQNTARGEAENEQRGIIAARRIANHYGMTKHDAAQALMAAQGWGYGYAARSLDLAVQARMVGYLECSEVGCRGARNGRQSVMLHQHLGAV